MQKESFLVVISILEGRNFPSRSKYKLIIECKFDGELLSTDPVIHNDAPNFTTELAWEMDRKALHQHRMQRTPVKLQCFAVDENEIRENVGYVLLDLRGAQQKAQTPKWYNLLSSKYSRMKPAIKIGMLLEDDSANSHPGFKAQEAPPRSTQISFHDKLEAILNEDEGYFQVGPDHPNSEMFVLAVTLGAAFNLEQLIYGDRHLPNVNSGFFFYYSLFGNDITNDAFHNLLSPNITPERASLRLRSTLNFLHKFVQEYSEIKVHLCCSDQVLGTANVSLSSLFSKKHLGMIDREPIYIDNVCSLFPPGREIDLKAAQPRLEVSLCLRKESVSTRSPKILNESPRKPVIDSEAAPDEQPVRDTDNVPLPLPVPVIHDDAAEREGNQTNSKPLAKSVDTENDAASINSEDNTVADDFQPLPNAGPTDENPSLATTETHTDIPAPMQHFRFTLDISTIHTLQLPHPCNIYIKYSYPFFGSYAPVLTGTAQVVNHTETRLPRSKCVFDFACPNQLLSGTFRAYPIVLEVWHRDKETKDIMLGTANLVLSKILDMDKVKFVLQEQDVKGKTCFRQTCHGSIPVLTRKEKLAQLNVVAVLEDFGIVLDQSVIRPTTKEKVQPEAQFTVNSPKKVQSEVSKQKSPIADPRQTDEYKTAIELELWKSQEKENFTNRFKEMEVQHLRLLGEEFSKRDKEREALVAKQISEYQELEKQLFDTISGLEKREQQVSSAELELNRLREDAVREKERTVAEAKEASKRMKDDCIHQVQLERDRRGLLEEQNKKLAKQVKELEEKYAHLMSQFHEYRNQQSTRPEMRLQAELNLAKLEKTEVERKLESATKSKLHYKQQWGRTLKELAMMKKREQEHAMANLKQQQQELETLKLQYLASGEKQEISCDQSRLKQIQKDIQNIKRDNTVIDQMSIAIESCQEKQLNNDEINERVSRLIEERDTLLRTGVYSEKDRIITELDRQIQEEMKRQSIKVDEDDSLL